MILFAISMTLLLPVESSAEITNDISDPLRDLYQEIQPNMSIFEVQKLFLNHSPKVIRWEIHEGDLRARNDNWSVSFSNCIPNIFTEDQFISTDLNIYFVGVRVGCLSYHYWGRGG